MVERPVLSSEEHDRNEFQLGIYMGKNGLGLDNIAKVPHQTQRGLFLAHLHSDLGKLLTKRSLSNGFVTPTIPQEAGN